MHYDDDAGLVKAVLDGDKDAFVFLVDRYQGAVYAYCLNQVRSEEDAKDVTQEVLLKAYLNLRQLKTPHAFRSWLYTIASNECRMWHRRHRSHEALEVEAGTGSIARGSDLETQLTVKKEIDALPESQRLVVLMHYFSGFSLKEIGEFLGTSREAIKARLFRARQRLGLRLKGAFEEYFDSSTKPNLCVAILDKITSLPVPSMSDSPVSKAHRLAPLPVAAVLSVVLLGGLAGFFPVGTHSGARNEGINVSLVDPDSDIEIAQTDGRKKRINASIERSTEDERRGDGGESSVSSAQVIGGGRVDDIVASPDGRLFAVRTPFGLEVHRPDGNQSTATIDTLGRIHSLAFSENGRFLVWNGDEQLTVWDVEEQKTVVVHSFDLPRRDRIKRFSGWLRMAIHPEMNEIAVVLPWHERDFDEIMFIDPISGDLLRSVKRLYTQDDLRSRNEFINMMQYSPDGNQLVILDEGTKYVAKTHRFVFLNPRDGEVLHKFEVPATIPKITYAYSPNGRWFAFPRRDEGRIDAVNTTDWKSEESFTFVGSAFWGGASYFFAQWSLPCIWKRRLGFPNG
ncbi:MAG: sigma-70 family RNA polymerase sigma factor [Candidatus Poribacteria bacterium]|nr:sigma-70 family RNA polymerase sigma factor [Candidatus Poribacteria bacterium]MDE0505090.1 sigma-70 family RNA polymerase sigma factor [Candidatus Poribacteria bacterium]